METVALEVPAGGLDLHVDLRQGSSSAQVVVVLGNGAQLASHKPRVSANLPRPPLYSSRGTGFPPRGLIEDVIVQILKEHGGEVSISNEKGWTIYDEVAARLSVPIEVRRRLTSTGEAAWRPEVGFARKNLEQRGVIAPTSTSGRGVWMLTSEVH